MSSARWWRAVERASRAAVTCGVAICSANCGIVRADSLSIRSSAASVFGSILGVARPVTIPCSHVVASLRKTLDTAFHRAGPGVSDGASACRNACDTWYRRTFWATR